MNNGTFLSGRVPLFFLARARAHPRVFFRCNRCHLARLFDNQWVTGGKEGESLPLLATSSVRRRHLLSSKAAPPQFEGGTFRFVPPHGTFCSTLWNTLFHAMEHLIPYIPIPYSRHWNRLSQALESSKGRYFLDENFGCFDLKVYICNRNTIIFCVMAEQNIRWIQRLANYSKALERLNEAAVI